MGYYENRKTTEHRQLTDLGIFDNKDELKFLRSLIINKKLFTQLHPYLDEKIFTRKPIKMLFNTLLGFYNEKHRLPTFNELEIVVKAKNPSKDELLDLNEIFEAIRNPKVEDGAELITEEAVKIIKGNEYKKIISFLMNSYEKNGYDSDVALKAQDMLKTLSGAFGDDDAEDTLSKITDAIYSPDIERISTGIKELDEHIGGGTPRGEVGMVIARAGGGKSTMGCYMSTKVALKGKKALYIYFENTERSVYQKIIATITGIETSSIGNGRKASEIEQALAPYKVKLQNNIRLKRMTTGVSTAEDIFNYITHLKLQNGWVPDFVFVDYLSCMTTSEKVNDLYERAAINMRKFENYAYQNQISFWVAEQANRSKTDEELKASAANRLSSVQGSFKTVQVASNVLYILNTENKNQASVFLDKCRTGGSLTSWTDIYFNQGTCRIDLSRHSNDDILTGVNYVEKALKEKPRYKLNDVA